jgi:hypothetical protein
MYSSRATEPASPCIIEPVVYLTMTMPLDQCGVTSTLLALPNFHLHHHLTISYSRPDPSSVLLCPQKLQITHYSYNFIFLLRCSHASKLPLQHQAYSGRPPSDIQPSQSRDETSSIKTECLTFLMLVFCRHVESLETNHPKPGKPCVEVELR